jgi:hypothetical protein
MTTAPNPIPTGATPAPGSNETNGTYRGGPRTEAGRAASSQNAISHGLFTLNDFILPGEELTYARFAAQLKQELRPVGILEEGLVEEIRRAMWRLRRCGSVECELAARIHSAGEGADPTQEIGSDAEKIQKSVDRARAQASRLRKQAMTELRQLQTERQIRSEIFPDTDTSDLGVVDSGKVLKATMAAKRNSAMQDKLDQKDAFANLDRMFATPPRLAPTIVPDKAA